MLCQLTLVAPIVGAWIEIETHSSSGDNAVVAPIVGAWIEIVVGKLRKGFGIVAPIVGAWIEMDSITYGYDDVKCRSYRGSVD